ncbi:TPA: hypothetical protein HA281_02190 [Candidatus Woesearchaeota archaeon]|nr:hypothetical protein [Deltaproteobacteria bacterium]HIH91590.1 hypothetical protein [Candidatus Woesearchaeota archaeon]HII63989.1 hypothetical protein [Candidatus Woesearchaeota archaeon]HIJ18453.1 hypothetical protein [Candidatus Woesearchaeota archaeon]
MDDDAHQELCAALHEQACSRGELSYTDPQTGLQAFTRLYLLKRPCCGTGCRHCPYGFRRK